MLTRIKSSLSSLCQDVDAPKKVANTTEGLSFPRMSSDLPALMNGDDKVTTAVSWAERMELETGKASN